MELILASASPRRSALLKEAGFSFRVIPADVTEIVPAPGNATFIALRNAMLKAENIAKRYPDALILGADTVIELDHETLGKPQDEDDARNILRRLSGRSHLVSTGVAIRSMQNNTHVFFTACSTVYFKVLTDEIIHRYMELVNVLDKAGAYGIQDHGDMIIDHYEGSFSNIMGLPVERVTESLRLLL